MDTLFGELMISDMIEMTEPNTVSIVSGDLEPVTDEVEVVVRDLENLLRSRSVSIDQLSEQEQEVVNTAREIEGCIIAGGAVLALYTGKLDRIKDWDLFFDSKESREAAIDIFVQLGFEESATSDWSKSYSKNDVIVQFVTYGNYVSPEEIFASFDLSVCCFAIEGDMISFTSQAKEDVDLNIMNFLSTKHPVICIKRIAKYGKKGFRPTTNFAMRFIKCVKGISMRTIRRNEGNGNQNGDS